MAFHSYAHLIRKLFNAYPLGPPSRVTGTSAWTCVDHLVSRLPPPTKNALFRLAFTAGARLSRLASPATATRRFIMQKARRHCKSSSDRLEANGFRDYFNPLVGVLFTFPSRYSFTIGLTGVFSLAGWSRQIRAGFLVSRVTQDANRPRLCSCTGLSPSVMQLSRCFHSTFGYHAMVLLPRTCIATGTVWAVPRSLATTGGITVVFSSWRY